MTEDKIIKQYMRNLYRIRYIMANVFHQHFECDILKATPQGKGLYELIEFEVKISKADLKKDIDKKIQMYRSPIINKHIELQQGLRVNKFYYILPLELIDYSIIPAYAGVIACEEQGKIVFRKMRNAKWLTYKLFNINDLLLDKFYFAYWNLKIKGEKGTYELNKISNP